MHVKFVIPPAPAEPRVQEASAHRQRVDSIEVQLQEQAEAERQPVRVQHHAHLEPEERFNLRMLQRMLNPHHSH